MEGWDNCSVGRGHAWLSRIRRAYRLHCDPMVVVVVVKDLAMENMIHVAQMKDLLTSRLAEHIYLTNSYVKIKLDDSNKSINEFELILYNILKCHTSSEWEDQLVNMIHPMSG